MGKLTGAPVSRGASTLVNLESFGTLTIVTDTIRSPERIDDRVGSAGRL